MMGTLRSEIVCPYWQIQCQQGFIHWWLHDVARAPAQWSVFNC